MAAYPACGVANRQRGLLLLQHLALYVHLAMWWHHLQSKLIRCAVYFTAGLPMMLPATGIRVTRLVHNEAQFGKTELDGLFGICTQAVNRYVNAGSDVTTSAQLVKALVANSPKHNVICGLALLNEKWLQASRAQPVKHHLGAI